MDNIGILDRKKTAFVLIDLQAGPTPMMDEINDVIKNIEILIRIAEDFKIPLIVTEESPERNGKTISQIAVRNLVNKRSFSCFRNEEFVMRVQTLGVESLILFGIESHISILKTALDGIKNNYNIHIVSDAVTSRSEDNKRIAIERMRQSGAFIASTEMILFQLIDKDGTEESREINSLLK